MGWPSTEKRVLRMIAKRVKEAVGIRPTPGVLRVIASLNPEPGELVGRLSVRLLSMSLWAYAANSSSVRASRLHRHFGLAAGQSQMDR